MKKLFFLITTVVLLSCSQDDLLFDPTDLSKTLVTLDSNLLFLEPLENDELTKSLPIYISTLVDYPRVLNVNLIEDETTADSSNYNYDPIVTIPANSHVGYFNIKGIDNSLEITDTEDVVFYITSDFSTSPTNPLDNKFTVKLSQGDVAKGRFYLEQITEPNPVLGPPIISGDYVLIQATSETNRFFNVKEFPAFGGLCSGAYINFNFNIIYQSSSTDFRTDVIDQNMTCDIAGREKDGFYGNYETSDIYKNDSVFFIEFYEGNNGDFSDLFPINLQKYKLTKF